MQISQCDWQTTATVFVYLCLLAIVTFWLYAHKIERWGSLEERLHGFPQTLPTILIHLLPVVGQSVSTEVGHLKHSAIEGGWFMGRGATVKAKLMKLVCILPTTFEINLTLPSFSHEEHYPGFNCCCVGLPSFRIYIF